MFRLIRESRLSILEISEPNYGAYYEAGYALGLGKEVVVCCSKEAFNRKHETEEEKYANICARILILRKSKSFFGMAMKIRKKLAEWIKDLFK